MHIVLADQIGLLRLSRNNTSMLARLLNMALKVLIGLLNLKQKSGTFNFKLDKSVIKIEPPRDKTNKMNVRPAQTQISLGIRSV